MLEAAKRELDEELGVTVMGIEETLVALADPGSPFVIEFVPTVIEGEPICREHMALAWVAVRDLISLPLAPSDKRFAVHLANTLGARHAV